MKYEDEVLPKFVPPWYCLKLGLVNDEFLMIISRIKIKILYYHVVVDEASVFRNEKSCVVSNILSRSNIRWCSINLKAVFIPKKGEKELTY